MKEEIEQLNKILEKLEAVNFDMDSGHEREHLRAAHYHIQQSIDALERV